jgi:type IV secretion system protein VirB10
MSTSAKPLPAETQSPVFARRPGPASAVGRAESRWTFLPGLGLALLLGGGVFMSLSNGRSAKAQMAPQRPSTIQGVQRPPAFVPAPAMPQPASPQPMSAPPPVAPTGPTPEDLAHLNAPTVVVDLAEAAGPPAVAASGVAAPPGMGAAPSDRSNPNERFAERIGSAGVETARATRLRDLALVAPQGTVIPAYLETAVNSDLPGFVRAVVSRDVRGFDGSTVLIPRGAKLIGQYRSGVAAGQTRAFVVWSRVLTPDGVSVEIGSPSADTLGRGGLEGETNSHFLRRFGASILLSVVGAGVEALGRDRGGDTAIVIGSPQQASNIATIALQREIDIPTTISVKQGTAIRVFVARDLDFSAVMAARR